MENFLAKTTIKAFINGNYFEVFSSGYFSVNSFEGNWYMFTNNDESIPIEYSKSWNCKHHPHLILKDLRENFQQSYVDREIIYYGKAKGILKGKAYISRKENYIESDDFFQGNIEIHSPISLRQSLRLLLFDSLNGISYVGYGQSEDIHYELIGDILSLDKDNKVIKLGEEKIINLDIRYDITKNGSKNKYFKNVKADLKNIEEFHISLATQRDISSITELYKQELSRIYQLLRDYSKKSEMNEGSFAQFISNSEKFVILKAEKNGELVGFVAAEVSEGMDFYNEKSLGIFSFAIKNSYKSTGVELQLLKAMDEERKKRGLPLLTAGLYHQEKYANKILEHFGIENLFGIKKIMV